MADNSEKQPEVDPNRAINLAHPSNSKKSKAEAEEQVKKITPIEGINAKIQKPKMSRRLRDAFTGDDQSSIGEYLLFQVAIPAIKATMYDLITGGANRALFGSGANNVRQAVQRGAGTVNYNQISRSQVNQPVMSERDKAAHNFDNVTFDTRMQADQALGALIDILEQYQVVAISDFYELVNITGSFADDKWGWFELHGADIVPARGGGFMIQLPRPKVIR